MFRSERRCDILAQSPVYCIRNLCLRPIDCYQPSGLLRMLRHIIALSILLMGLLAAGVPALACGEVVPSHDCCPNGPNAPCAPEQARTAEASRPDFCCATGGTIATITAIATPSNELRKHWGRADLPVLLVVLTTLTTPYVQSAAADDFRIVTPLVSSSTLYLRTGRLRL